MSGLHLTTLPKLVGFFTKDKIYTARVTDVRPDKGNVRVDGELIETEHFVVAYTKYIKGLFKECELKF